MVATLQKARTTAANESLVSEDFSREALMIAERLERHVLERHGPTSSSGRKLRNRIIVANVVVWILITALICLVFF